MKKWFKNYIANRRFSRVVNLINKLPNVLLVAIIVRISKKLSTANLLGVLEYIDRYTKERIRTEPPNHINCRSYIPSKNDRT